MYAARPRTYRRARQHTGYRYEQRTANRITSHYSYPGSCGNDRPFAVNDLRGNQERNLSSAGQADGSRIRLGSGRDFPMGSGKTTQSVNMPASGKSPLQVLSGEGATGGRFFLLLQGVANRGSLWAHAGHRQALQHNPSNGEMTQMLVPLADRGRVAAALCDRRVPVSRHHFFWSKYTMADLTLSSCNTEHDFGDDAECALDDQKYEQLLEARKRILSMAAELGVRVACGSI